MSFGEPAMDWLNATAAVQQAVKCPIELLLRRAFGVERVDYAIDGQIVDGWDA